MTRRRVLYAVPAALVLLAVGLPVGGVLYLRWAGERELARVTADLDAREPGWRFADRVAAYNAALPPPDRNPAGVVAAAVANMPAGWNKIPGPITGSDKPANQRLKPADAAALLATVTPGRPGLDAARPAVGMPSGGRVMSPDPRAIDGTPAAAAWEFSRLAAASAVAHAEAGNSPAAVTDVRLVLAAGRAIGPEPVLMSRLHRTAAGQYAVGAVGRVLNQGEPRAGLAELQADLLAEAATFDPADAARATRAGQDTVFDHPLFERRHTVLTGVAGHRAAELLGMSAVADAWAGPPAGRRAALPAARPTDPDDIVGAAARLAESTARARALLSCAGVAVACERFRQRAGRWPGSLAEIPADLLPAAPADPFTGGPLILKRLPDGVVVFSAGPDGTDDGGPAARGRPVTDDVGVRLWDPASRGRPAKPPGAANE